MAGHRLGEPIPDCRNSGVPPSLDTECSSLVTAITLRGEALVFGESTCIVRSKRMPEYVTHGVLALRALPFACGFVLISLALGRGLSHWLGTSSASLGERAVVAFGLGAGSLQFVPFLLGVAGVLEVEYLVLALLVLAVLLGRHLLAVLRSAGSAVQQIRGADTWIKWWVVALVPALLMAGLVAVSPAVDPDGVSYHLTAPKRWLQQGELAYLPTYPYTNAPMGVEILFGMGLALGGDVPAKAVHWLLGTAAIPGLYFVGTRLRGPVTGVIAATLYLAGPRGVAQLLGWAYVEGAASFAMVASLLAWTIWFQEKNLGWLRASALLAGIAVSYKLTAVLFPMALTAITLLAMRQAGPMSWQSALPAIRSASLMAVPVVPWLLRAWALTGNPIFPVFAKLIPSRDFTPEQAASFDEYNRYMVWAGSHEEWSLDERKLMLLGVALAVVAVAVFYFLRSRTAFGRGCTVVLACTTLVQLYAVGLYGRYWQPTLSVLVVPMVAPLEGWLVSQGRRLALVGVAGLLSLYQVRSIASAMQNDLAGLLKTALGLEDQHDFRLRHLPLTPIYDYVNTRLPESAAVVLSHYCGGFQINRRTYCAEFVQSSLRFDTWEHFLEDAHRLGVTHVIAPRVLAEGGKPPLGVGNAAVLVREQQFAVLGRLLTHDAKLLTQALDQGLYEVTLPKAPEHLRQ